MLRSLTTRSSSASAPDCPETLAYRAYRLEMFERRRVPQDAPALLAAQEARKQAEYRAHAQAVSYS